MKGRFFAGGRARRCPQPVVTYKTLLPVYDKPMVYYPVSALVLAEGGDGLNQSKSEGLPDLKRPLVINALQFQKNSSGIGIMTRELFVPFCRRLARPCTVVLAKDSPPFPVENAHACVFRAPYGRTEHLRRLWFQSFRLGRLCRGGTLVTIDSKIPLFLPKDCKLFPIVTDLAIYHLSETYPASRVFLWKLQFQLLRRRATRFYAISEFTKRDLMERFHLREEQVRVIPCAASSRVRRETDPARLASVRKTHGLPERYVLFVGNFNPRKNLDRVLRAFDLVKQRTALPHKLVIVGAHGWKFDREAAVRKIRAKDDVLFPGYVADEDMGAVYTMADAFLFPTLYEGFGIPILEAQQCGVPVLAGNCTAMPEVGGAGACYADPYSVDEIADMLERLLTDGAFAQALREKGAANAKRFSWDRSAELLQDYIEKDERA